MTAGSGRPGAAWVLDRQSRELRGLGRSMRLPDKPFRALLTLIEAEGDVVTRTTLQQRLWSDDTFVDFENNLNSAMATLRQVLGDSARQPRYIETIPKVGYRLIGPILLARSRPDLAEQTDSTGVPLPRPAATLRAWTTNGPLVAWAALLALGVITAVLTLAVSSRAREDTAAQAAARPHLDRGRYLRGQFLVARGSPRLLDEALAAFREAAGANPASADAAAEEAETLVEAAFAGSQPFTRALSEARQLARRALALDRAHAGALRTMGMTALFLDWDFAAAGAWLRRAGRRSPDAARTWLARATFLGASGRYADAAEAAERAVALNPAAYYVRADLAMFYLIAGRSAEAAESSRLVLKVAPDFVPAMAHALTAYERLGNWDAAGVMARRLMHAAGAAEDDQVQTGAQTGRAVVEAWRHWDLQRIEAVARTRTGGVALSLALRQAAVGDRAAALASLGDALERREPMLVFIRAFPEFAVLRGDPVFERIATDVASGRPGQASTAGAHLPTAGEPPA